MTKVLVTGATGFIGIHLVERNLEEKKSVRIFALPGDQKAKAFESQGLEVVYGDIRDARAVEKAVEGQEVVFHLAAVVTDWAPKKLFEQVNVEGVRNICEACLRQKVQRLVEVSTNDVFGLKEGVVIDETFEYTPWGEPYPDTKLAATEIVLEYHKKGLPVSMVYPCWVYGPGDLTFVPLVADSIKKKNLIFWRKNVLIWPAYIENLIDLLMLIAWHPRAVGEGFIIHDGVSDTFQNFSARIAAAIGMKAPRLHVPYKVAYYAAWASEVVWRLLRKKNRPLLTKYTVKILALD